MLKKTKPYRTEIDGLRALAVLAVLFFHLDFSSMSRGYLGVDIFFVISGYLITGILTKKYVHKGNSLLEFYERRLRRLGPSLFITIALTLILGYFLELPSGYSNLAKSALATLGFVSNHWFFIDIDYFSLEANARPLLHTWSL